MYTHKPIHAQENMWYPYYILSIKHMYIVLSIIALLCNTSFACDSSYQHRVPFGSPSPYTLTTSDTGDHYSMSTYKTAQTNDIMEVCLSELDSFHLTYYLLDSFGLSQMVGSFSLWHILHVHTTCRTVLWRDSMQIYTFEDTRAPWCAGKYTPAGS